ncbi:MAG: hypothetical protein IJX76_05250 [Clostridia bacterium]|nr:hypothetical protein [Clostridia bacterium]
MQIVILESFYEGTNCKWIAEGAVNRDARISQYSATADRRYPVGNMFVFRKWWSG